MGEWREVSFEKLFKIPLRNGLTKPSRVRGSGFLMVNMKEIFSIDRIDGHSMERVPLNEKEIQTSLLEKGDLLFARQSLVLDGAGKCSIIKNIYEKMTFESHLIRCRLDESQASSEFYYYLFSSNYGKNLMKTIVEQVAAAGIRGSDLAKLKVPCPPLEMQHTISKIGQALDDKIELNRKMNETLEEMARAIFKSWFMDFDPVHAKARGEEPAGMPDEIADLFPSEFVHSDQLNKPIPKGWEVKSLSQLAENVKRAISADSIDPESNYIGLEHMPKRCIALAGWERAEKVTSNKFGFKTGEILFGKLRPYFHKVGIAPVDGICSTDILVIKPKKEKHFGLVLCVASSDAIITSVTSSSTGTKMPRTNWQDVSKFTVVIPDNEVVDNFNQFINTLTNRIINNIHENIILTSIRDSLLPKLISGEIEV